MSDNTFADGYEADEPTDDSFLEPRDQVIDPIILELYKKTGLSFNDDDPLIVAALIHAETIKTANRLFEETVKTSLSSHQKLITDSFNSGMVELNKTLEEFKKSTVHFEQAKDTLIADFALKSKNKVLSDFKSELAFFTKNNKPTSDTQTNQLISIAVLGVIIGCFLLLAIQAIIRYAHYFNILNISI